MEEGDRKNMNTTTDKNANAADASNLQIHKPCVSKPSVFLTASRKQSHAYEFRNLRTLSKTEINELSYSLKGFEGNDSSLLTFLIHPQEKLNKFIRMIHKELDGLSTKLSSDDFNFRFKSVEWFLKKFDTGIGVPKNGIAIFAGVVRTNLKDPFRRVLTRVMVAFQPEYMINTTTYVWDPKFHPELLMANIDIDLKFGFLVVSPTKVTIGMLQEKKSTIEYIDYDANTNSIRNVEAEMKRLTRETGKWFTCRKEGESGLDVKPKIVGVVIAFTNNFSREIARKIKDPQRIFHPSLLKLMGKSIDVEECGLSGLKEAIDTTCKFRQETWFVYQKNVIWKQCPIDFPTVKTPLHEHLKQLGLGFMESVTEVFYRVPSALSSGQYEEKSVYANKLYINFENRRNIFQKVK